VGRGSSLPSRYSSRVRALLRSMPFSSLCAFLNRIHIHHIHCTPNSCVYRTLLLTWLVIVYYSLFLTNKRALRESARSMFATLSFWSNRHKVQGLAPISWQLVLTFVEELGRIVFCKIYYFDESINNILVRRL
jgi:hypothetical protein